MQLFVKKCPFFASFLGHPQTWTAILSLSMKKHYLSKLKAFLLFCGWFPANAQGNWDSFLNFRHRIELLASQGFGVKQKSSLMQIIWKNLSGNFPAFWKFSFVAFCTKLWWFGIKAMIFTFTNNLNGGYQKYLKSWLLWPLRISNSTFLEVEKFNFLQDEGQDMLFEKTK